MDYKAIIRALLLFLSFAHAMAFGSSNISCPDSERKALLRFVGGFNPTAEAEREAQKLLWFAGDFNRTAADFSSWEGKDCCRWEGVECDDRTGHVVRLDLQWRGIVGTRIDPSLLRLKQLSYLDLSANFFDFISIPPWIGSFEKLNYLNLSRSFFNGTVPDQLGNLSRLQTLDLSYNYFLTLSNADWLSRLTSLLHIDMSFFSIGNTSNWLQALNTLPLVQDIRLRSCCFGKFPQSLPHVNFTSLSLLDLSYAFVWDDSNDCKLNSSLPDWPFRITSLQYIYLNFIRLMPCPIGNLSSYTVQVESLHIDAGVLSSLSNLCELRTLNLSYSTINFQLDALEASFPGCLKNSLQELYLTNTSLSGNMPDWIGDLNNLNILDLSSNSLSGPVPASLCTLSKLQVLDFSFSRLNGNFPECLGKFGDLKTLKLRSNSFTGVISEQHFSNLTKLETIDLNSNSLVLNLSYNWVPPFQLSYLDIRGCKLGAKFPSWLQTQKPLTYLDLSSTSISDSVPNWFWNSMTNLSTLYLANNELHGVVPNSILFSDDPDLSIDLSSNFFRGPVPHFPPNTAQLDLSNNSFWGPIPDDIFQLMPNLSVVSLSMNKINGGIPSSVCNSKLVTISISNNNLSGELPNCEDYTQLEALDLSNNNLSGGIPKWLCELPQFQSLHLRKNSLSGELPSSLKTCKHLEILDLGGNMFTGRIPIWLGELLLLKILSLRSNKFVGRIPTELSNLNFLQILDLSNNNLSGPIPMSFGNFTSMTTPITNIGFLLNISLSYNYAENMILDVKGREDLYDSDLLSQITILDLSRNSLSGSIPDELTNLLGLLIFDLSSNDLTGQVPSKIDNMMQLQYLNLSRNKFSGAIPSSLSNLSFLEILDLSYNNFSGMIPTGRQMDTFPPNMYIGNQYLCGFQINVSCTGNKGKAKGPTTGQPSQTPTSVSDENRKEILLLCLITIAGFAVGFWAISGVLLVHKRFRIWWFRYVDSLYDSLYVTSRVWFVRLKKKM